MNRASAIRCLTIKVVGWRGDDGPVEEGALRLIAAAQLRAVRRLRVGRELLRARVRGLMGGGL